MSKHSIKETGLNTFPPPALHRKNSVLSFQNPGSCCKVKIQQRKAKSLLGFINEINLKTELRFIQEHDVPNTKHCAACECTHQDATGNVQQRDDQGTYLQGNKETRD
jgi:hypothetical protein